MFRGNVIFVAFLSACVVTTNARICNSTEIISSNVRLFDELKGCTAIAGNLHIVLCEKFTEETISKLSFPELREISGYFLIYVVHGLTSLGKLFPNLAVIRGNVLVKNYSLIILRAPDLIEVRTDEVYFCVRPLRTPLQFRNQTIKLFVLIKFVNNSNSALCLPWNINNDYKLFLFFFTFHRVMRL